MIFYVTTPMKRGIIGKYHTTLGEAKRAALRAAKRRNEHTYIKHWKTGIRFVVFPDGSIVKQESNT